MSKSISRDEKRRRLESAQGGAGEQGEMESAAVEVAPVTITKWAGLENYECGMCAYATLDGAAMGAHLRGVHGITNYELRITNEEAEGAAEAATTNEVENNQDEVM